MGDDIAWIRIGPDGRLYAVNPEAGFFGVAPGTSEKTNPNALAATKKNTIFTNVAINNDDMTVWWEGLDKNPPENATEWKGAKVNGKEYTARATSSRIRTPVLQHRQSLPVHFVRFENPQGVPLSAIVFAAAAQRRLRWYTRRLTGITAYL